jgi:hypothetical protein
MRSVNLKLNIFFHFSNGILVRLTTTYWTLTVWSTYALAQDVLPTTRYSVGIMEVQYIEPANGGRPLDYILIYPAVANSAAAPFKVFLCLL